MRCKKGTRKNKAGDCVAYVALSKPVIDSIIQEYGLKPSAASYIKKMKATKRRTDYYTYNPEFTELENLDAKARARVAEILKYGTAKEKKLIL